MDWHPDWRVEDSTQDPSAPLRPFRLGVVLPVILPGLALRADPSGSSGAVEGAVELSWMVKVGRAARSRFVECRSSRVRMGCRPVVYVGCVARVDDVKSERLSSC